MTARRSTCVWGQSPVLPSKSSAICTWQFTPYPSFYSYRFACFVFTSPSADITLLWVSGLLSNNVFRKLRSTSFSCFLFSPRCRPCVIDCQKQQQWRMYVNAWGTRCLIFDSPWDMVGSAPLAPAPVDWLKVERCASWQRPCLAESQLYAHDSMSCFFLHLPVDSQATCSV